MLHPAALVLDGNLLFHQSLNGKQSQLLGNLVVFAGKSGKRKADIMAQPMVADPSTIYAQSPLGRPSRIPMPQIIQRAIATQQYREHHEGFL
jgi:hypothetical protein